MQRVYEWDYAKKVEIVLQTVEVKRGGVVMLVKVNFEEHQGLTLINDASPDEGVQVLLSHGVQLLVEHGADVLGELQQKLLVMEVLRGLLLVGDNDIASGSQVLVKSSRLCV
jgi:hypothetical protein